MFHRLVDGAFRRWITDETDVCDDEDPGDGVVDRAVVRSQHADVREEQRHHAQHQLPAAEIRKNVTVRVVWWW